MILWHVYLTTVLMTPTAMRFVDCSTKGYNHSHVYRLLPAKVPSGTWLDSSGPTLRPAPATLSAQVAACEARRVSPRWASWLFRGLETFVGAARAEVDDPLAQDKLWMNSGQVRCRARQDRERKHLTNTCRSSHGHDGLIWLIQMP